MNVFTKLFGPKSIPDTTLILFHAKRPSIEYDIPTIPTDESSINILNSKQTEINIPYNFLESQEIKKEKTTC